MIPQPDRGYVSVECRKLLSDCTEKAMKVEDLSVRSKLKEFTITNPYI